MIRIGSTTLAAIVMCLDYIRRAFNTTNRLRYHVIRVVTERQPDGWIWLRKRLLVVYTTYYR